MREDLRIEPMEPARRIAVLEATIRLNEAALRQTRAILAETERRLGSATAEIRALLDAREANEESIGIV